MAGSAPYATGLLRPPDRKHLVRYGLDPVFDAPPKVRRASVDPAYDIWSPRQRNQNGWEACCGYGSQGAKTSKDRVRFDPLWAWQQAKIRDEFGNPDANRGTTVRAVCEVYRDLGNVRVVGDQDQPVAKQDGIKEFRWAQTLNAICNAIAGGTAVIAGIDWPEAWFQTQDYHGKPCIGVGGPGDWGGVNGGHCIEWNEFDLDLELFTFVQTWGPDWGDNGLAAITFRAAQWALDQGGEFAVITDNLDAPPAPLPPPTDPDSVLIPFGGPWPELVPGGPVYRLATGRWGTLTFKDMGGTKEKPVRIGEAEPGGVDASFRFTGDSFVEWVT